MGEGQVAARIADISALRDEEIRRFLEESLEPIRRALGPEILVFFGSRVWGQPDEWSDIDLFIVSREFENMRVIPRADLFHSVAQPHTHVDAICYTPEEYERMVQEPSLIREIMESGLRVI
jgi:predicted nucleotidyltransferase